MPRSEAIFAEGVGLEPTSPFGQRFSSYEHDVLTLTAFPRLDLFEQVNDDLAS